MCLEHPQTGLAYIQGLPSLVLPGYAHHLQLRLGEAIALLREIQHDGEHGCCPVCGYPYQEECPQSETCTLAKLIGAGK